VLFSETYAYSTYLHITVFSLFIAYLTLSQEDLLEQQKREEELEKYQKEQKYDSEN
jgi:hypothetical protein